MTSRVPLRTQSLLIFGLTTLAALSGCVGEAGVPQDLRSAGLGTDWLPSAALRTALAEQPESPWQQRPQSLAEAAGAWAPTPDPVPMPQAAADQPLVAALTAYAAGRGADPSEVAALPSTVEAMGLDAASEASLARLVLAFLEAERLQAQAVSDLTVEEMLFIGHDAGAVEAWTLRTGETGFWAYDEEVSRLLEKVDFPKTLQASDLLARAVDDVRQTVPSLSVPASNHGAVEDDDSDGAPNSVETVGGSDPGDRSDDGGSVWRGADGDHDGEVVRAPGVAKDTNALVELPGLLVLGGGDTRVTRSYDLIIDLGGNDIYEGRHVGGVLPMPDRILLTNPIPQPRFVSLIVDVGGNDQYLPPLESTPVNEAASVDALTTSVSLGGAVLGVSTLADMGGQNTFSAQVRTVAIAKQSASIDRTASATAIGASQGAGMYGGVGVLATWDSTNTFRTSVHAEAAEEGINTKTPTATGAGITQGGGWLGLGVLTTFGAGEDSFQVNVTTLNTGGSEQDRYPFAVAQGAARGGGGVLLDEGGPSTMQADAAVAQGAAWPLFARNALDSGDEQPGTPYLHTHAALGVLWGSPDDSEYSAAELSQGAAYGARKVSSGPGEEWFLFDSGYERRFNAENQNPNDAAQSRWAPAFGVLVEPGGNDAYAATANHWDVGTQGAGLVGGGALLLDAAGDDTYDARELRLAQGAGWLGQGVLMDLFGHDTYLSGAEAQGFATDDPRPLLRARACHGQPQQLNFLFGESFCTREGIPGVGKSDPYTKGTGQLVADLAAQVPSLGVLVDRHGIDRYKADERAQGAAQAFLQYAVGAGYCHPSHINAPGLLFPIPPVLKECGPHYPGSEHDGTKTPWTEQDVRTPGSQFFLLGLFIDTGHRDTYEYGDPSAKKNPDGSERTTPPNEDNDWTWSQVESPEHNLNQTNVPEKVEHGGHLDTADGVAQQGNVEEGTVAGLNHPREAVPDQPYPGDPLVFGVGIDQNDAGRLGGSLQDTLGTLAPVTVTLTAEDQAGNALGDGDPVTDTVTLHLEHDAGPFQVDRIDFLANGRLVERVSGAEASYTIPWDTTLRVGNDPTFPDGTYWVQASVIVHAGARMMSFESNPIQLGVNNPPLLNVELEPKAISPTGADATLTVGITPDLTAADEDLATLEEGEKPGGHLTVSLVRRLDGATTPVLPRTFVASGDHTFTIDGSCGASACPDGMYDVVVLAEGYSAEPGETSTNQDEEELLIDGTPPASRVDLPPVAGLSLRAPGQGLIVPWERDLNPGGADGFADVDRVDVFRIHDPGTATERVQYLGSSSIGPTTVFEGIATDVEATFLTVATDALGNTESPCIDAAEETVPCSLHKRLQHEAGDPLGPITTRVDFSPPRITDFKRTPSHGFVRPEATDVVFEARVEEQGSGIASMAIIFDDGQAFQMDAVGDGLYRFDEWVEDNGHRSADEETFLYTIVARDHGNNKDDVVPNDIEGASGVLDAVPPRITVLATEYEDLEGTPRSAGRAGGQVFVRLQAEDATLTSIASVQADFSGLHPDLSTTACGPDLETFDVTDWSCTVVILEGVEDGLHEVPVTATDLVGNQADAVADVVVSDDAVVITDVTVAETGPHHAVLTWTTTEPASSRVYYGHGRDASLDSRTERVLDGAVQHEVRIEGLSPSTDYRAAVASENLAGRETRSAPLHFRTTSAVGLSFTGLDEGQVLTGEVTVDVALGLSGTDPTPATVTLFSERTDGIGGREKLVDGTSTGGTVSLTVNTTHLADGPVRLVAQGVRGRDLAEASSPTLVVDNTAPVLVPVRPLPDMGLRADDPVVDILTFNAGGGSGLDLASLTVLLDDAPVAVSEAGLGDGDLTRTLRFRLPAGTPVGEHVLVVDLADGAGNVATLTLPFELSAEGDDAGLVDYLGHAAARPGAPVGLVFRSPSALDAVSIDPAPVGHGLVPLEHQGAWRGSWTVPEGTASGTYRLDAILTDVNGGTMRQEGALRLVVDADAPAVTAALHPDGPAAATLEVASGEPVRLDVWSGDELLASEPVPATTHSVELTGLPPGELVSLRVVGVDGAGNEGTALVHHIMPADAQPPEPVSGLEAHVVDGTVHLTWQPSGDDSGIAGYRVERGDGAWTRTVAGTTAADATGHGDQRLSYNVFALDVAGKKSTPEAVQVTVPAYLEVLETVVAPDAGSTATPFDVQFSLRHNLFGADKVVMVIEGRNVHMTALDTAADCRAGCWYSTQATLPATRLSEPLQVTLAVAGDEAAAQAAAPTPRVVVTQADAGEDAPAPLLLLALLGALLVARRWRR